MKKTIHLTADVPDSREIRICLPGEVPVGPAHLTVSINAPPGSEVPGLGELRKFAGLWRDRSDIADNLEFAHRLRSTAWRRPE